MLRCDFKGLLGEKSVQMGEYQIRDVRRPGYIIRDEEWQRLVLPGTVQNMSIILIDSPDPDKRWRVFSFDRFARYSTDLKALDWSVDP